MKPCRQNRKQISWLVAGCLEPGDEVRLRSHIASCQACRDHFANLSRTKEALVANLPPEELPAAEGFHRRLMSSIREQPTDSLRAPVFEMLFRKFFGWGAVLPAVVTMTVVFGGFWFMALQPPRLPMSKSGTATVTSAPASVPDLAPTLQNYEMVADSSLEKLDELITDQSRRNPPPGAVYTAAGWGRSLAD